MDSRKAGPRASRRDFLVGALLGGFSLAGGFACAGSPSSRPAQSPRHRSRKLGVALLGLGQYSEQRLGPALKGTQHCALRGIVTGSPHKIEPWQREYAIADSAVYNYASLQRIADNPAIDVVYVVTPTALHAKYAIMAAEAGKHVWCEKPMAMNVQECRAIIDACRAHKVSLSIGYRMHHEPNTQAVMQFAKTKPYGAIRSLRAIVGYHGDGEVSWRMDPAMGGGALYDLGVYSINAIRYASGEEPVRVRSARHWADRPALYRAVDENTEFQLELQSGVLAYGKASLSQSENVLRVEAERGWYQLEPMQSYEGVKGTTSDGQQLDRPIDHQQARQVDDDALAILEGRAPMVPGEEGLRDVRIVEAIFRAAKTGAPVDIAD